jgi:glycosyltransferase involved in cell wall biosynthesis
VLHVGADDTAGGVASYIASMVPEFDAHDVETHITVSTERLALASTNFPHSCIRHGMPLAYGPLSLWLSAAQLRRILRRERVDVLHLHTARAGFVGVLAALGTGVPIVYTGHGLRFEQKKTRLGRAAFRFCEKLICSLADRSTMLTKRDRRFAIRCGVVSPEKAVAVRTRISSTRTSSNDNLHSTFPGGPSRAAFVMGAVGMLEGRKDPLAFLRAAKLVSNELPNASFVWVGDGELRGQIEGAARDLGIFNRFTITGRISRQEVSQWLHKMDVFVFPSTLEGVPLAVLEAFAARLPVVCSRYRGSGWYYVAKSDQTALTFAPGDAESCARSVLRIAKDKELKEQLAAAGNEHFSQHHNGSDVMAREYMAIYSELLGRSAARQI